jgi:O-acetyl-ADP-ribose deacetylase (regulator of RNase III)
MYLKLFTRYPQFVKRKALYVPASMRQEGYVSCAVYGVLGLAGGPDAILHSRQDAQVPRREDVMGDFAGRIDLVRGDITEQDVDAIVNAANTTLLGGGGVDGAIHRAGGPDILAECRRLGGCATGDAKLTTGGRLKARYVIHTVGPVYRDGRRREPEILASAYRRSLEVASQHGVARVAFPSISTGAYGYPIRDAARIALRTVADYLGAHDDIQLVRFVLFSPADLAAYEEAAAEIGVTKGR